MQILLGFILISFVWIYQFWKVQKVFLYIFFGIFVYNCIFELFDDDVILKVLLNWLVNYEFKMYFLY